MVLCPTFLWLLSCKTRSLDNAVWRERERVPWRKGKTSRNTKKEDADPHREKFGQPKSLSFSKSAVFGDDMSRCFLTKNSRSLRKESGTFFSEPSFWANTKHFQQHNTTQVTLQYSLTNFCSEILKKYTTTQ